MTNIPPPRAPTPVSAPARPPQMMPASAARPPIFAPGLAVRPTFESVQRSPALPLPIPAPTSSLTTPRPSLPPPPLQPSESLAYPSMSTPGPMSSRAVISPSPVSSVMASPIVRPPPVNGMTSSWSAGNIAHLGSGQMPPPLTQGPSGIFSTQRSALNGPQVPRTAVSPAGSAAMLPQPTPSPSAVSTRLLGPTTATGQTNVRALPAPPLSTGLGGLNGLLAVRPRYPPNVPHVGQAAALPPPPPSNGIMTTSMSAGNMTLPTMPLPQPSQPTFGLNSRLGGLSLSQGMDAVDLLQNRHILPPKGLPVPKPRLHSDYSNNMNCSPDIFRCTLNKIPETENLLKKARLPLGILIHPFKDLSHLPVIQCSTIVRCRQCRTYINPFVSFVDQRRWRCNICYRVNDLPEEFLYDPVTKTHGDPSRRPECKSSTIEFIAPAEYMLRPPQPAVYVFLLDTSRQAVDSGYLQVFCDVLLDELDKLPGDARTQIAFITYNEQIHFYCMSDGSCRPNQLIVSDLDEAFVPRPSDLLVNLCECRSLVIQLLEHLPEMFQDCHATSSALGAALQVAFKLASPTGGRVSVFQHILPQIGPGALVNREIQADAKNASDSSLLGPATDFYKKLSLDCSSQQVAVDLFAMGGQYQDLASLSGIANFSAGQIQHFAGYHVTQNPVMAAKFEASLRRYLTRKIGFEAVMRVRCTRGLSLHTFHGNFFVRSTDLLSLPNINPDSGFGIQVQIEDDLRDSREVSFQAALLYTSSKGERRIRVHTLCLPTTASVMDVINGADQQAIIAMLTKFATDRSLSGSVSDAKEGLVVSCVDAIETYRAHSSISTPNGLLLPQSLRLMPLYVLACLRSAGFRPGIRLDERSYCFSQFKTLPVPQLLQLIYPDLYRVDNLSDEGSLSEEAAESSEDEATEILIPQPERLQLSFENISATGMYLLDVGDMFYLYLCRGLHAYILEKCFNVTRLQELDESLVELPELPNVESERLRTLVQWLNSQKAYPAPIKIIREDGKSRHLFLERMVDDRVDKSFSYFEFLQHLKQQIKSA